MAFHQGLAGESYDRQYSNKELLHRIWDYAKPHKLRLVFLLLLTVFYGASGAMPPYLVSRVLDESRAAHTNQTTLTWLVIVVIVIEISAFVFYHFMQRTRSRVIADMLRDLSSDALAASMRQDLVFHDTYSSGKIVSRITSDTSDFGSLITLTSSVLNDVLQSTIIAIILFQTEWRLASILLMIVPVLLLIIGSFRKLARKATTAGMQAMANVNSTIKETISGIAVAKNFRQEETILKDFNAANEMSYEVNVKRGLILSIVFPTTRFLTGMVIGLLTYFGARSAMAGLITAGAWYMFILSADKFMLPMLSIASYWNQVQTGFSAAERVLALIDSKRSVIQTGNYEPAQIEGRIDFEHVSFSYGDGTKVLNDFSLHIKPGENVAIVGHTGAGKSSIARLICRFYEFQGGEILIDRHDIRSFDLHALRSHMGIVTQVPFLFEGTVEENIRFSKPEITREQILSLAHQIGRGEWLDTFSNGLDTRVGERGAQISMGQRQLVALMRVLAHGPSIFILDEATASIDPFTEKQIQAALNLILKRSTSILIAHRLSTVKSADRIIVLDHGVITESGKHDDLLQQGGSYATLYNTYFRHQSLSYVEEAGEELRKQ
ncbi:MAG: ABC transporter ATP-binding protein [Anaerolineaceae bacterium]|jgi:ATP-binding cassette subfamily B protein